MKTDLDLIHHAFYEFKRNRNMPFLKLGELLSDEGRFSTVFDLTDGQRELVLKVISTGDTPVSDPAEALAYARSERDTMLACQNYRFNNMDGISEWEYTMRLLDYFEYPVENSNGNYLVLFVMPKYIQLREYCENYNLTEDDITVLISDISHALDICEKNQILHRDVKPSNIFVYKDNEKLRFILGDFGVARELLNTNEPVTGIGSFKAPELYFRKPLKGFNSDIYSLGMTLFFLTTSDYAVAASQKMAPSEFHPVLREIMNGSVEFDPAKRFQHAGDILEMLKKVTPRVFTNNPDVVNIASRCKCLLIARDFTNGIKMARDGLAKGDRTCANLYAYATFCAYRNDGRKIEEVMELLREMIKNDDNTARCLFSLIGLSIVGDNVKSTEAGNYKRLMQYSALNGCVIAQYYYGRWLFDGQMGFASDSKEGMKYLMGAVNNGFAPALLYLKTRIEHKDRRFEYSPEMLSSLKTELNGFDKSRIAEAVVLAI